MKSSRSSSASPVKLSPKDLQDLRKRAELELERRQNKERLNALKPQHGPQERFLNSTADVVFFGGAAGGGKTHSLLLQCARPEHLKNPGYGAVIFRREMPQITAQGGLWDNACELYPLLGGKPIQSPQLLFRFPSGAKIQFRHLQYEKDIYDWQGSQVVTFGFDELTHFTWKQFNYMFSRNRSTCGIHPRMFAGFNPEPDHWVAKFIEWWIDRETGFAIPARSGVVRYFVVIDDVVRWDDSREALATAYGMRPEDCTSFTFIASSIYDNKILLAKDPAYLAKLKALSTVEQARLLGGNWIIRPAAGMYFPRDDRVKIVPSPPFPVVATCRAWDLAATLPTPRAPSPDATSGTLIGRMENGQYIVLHNEHGCWAPDTVEATVVRTATNDRTAYPQTTVRLPQDPGQAGKSQVQIYTRKLAGYPVTSKPVTGDKITRAKPFSSQWLAGNVCLLQGAWNEAYLKEMEGFPDGPHDDDPDSSSDAFMEVALPSEPVSDVVEVSREDLLSSSPYAFFQEESW